MHLLLLRHPPVAVSGVCYGRRDIEPAPGWEAVAARWRDALSADYVLYSSPLMRCRRPAERLGEPICDARLMELDFGRWEGLAWDAIPRNELDAWSADYVEQAPPGGESYRWLHHRVSRFYEELLSAAPAHAVVVSHAGPIRALLARILDIPPAAGLRLRIEPGSLSAVTVQGDWVQLDYLNRSS